MLEADGPCEDPGCPVQWEAICRWCGQKFCMQHIHTHGCSEGWLAKRLLRPIDVTPIAWVEVEEDD